MGARITMASWRQVYPAIQRNYTRDVSARAVLDDLFTHEEGAWAKGSTGKGKELSLNIREEQSGHSKWMEELVYGILYSESPNSTLSEREDFRKVSVDWHKFLGFSSALEDPVEGSEARRQEELRLKADQFLRWKKIRAIQLTQALHQLHGPGAVFRGLQKKALKAIIEGERRLMVIMGTGKGKSLLFMLPVKAVPGGLTVVIVPLVSLKDDLKRRCDQSGIRSAEWSSKKHAFQADIIFVVPESAVTKEFQRFLESRKLTGGVDRIILDECHMLLDSLTGWRPKMLELVSMVDKGIQLIFLTATMRPKDEPDLLAIMNLREEDLRIMREETSRKNLEYRVLEYNRQDEVMEVRRVVEQKLREYEQGKIIIYVRDIRQGDL
ncbi:P-loop containing nucleoside triphosphate hydrolase protein, partial [Elsinoe ampelina]